MSGGGVVTVEAVMEFSRQKRERGGVGDKEVRTRRTSMLVDVFYF